MGWDGVAFARRLRVVLAERGLKPKELAEQAGLSYAQVGRMLRGERESPPSKAELAAIAGVLNVRVDDLTEGNGFPPRPATPPGVDGVALANWMDAVEARLEAVEEAAARRAARLDVLLERLEQTGVLRAP